MFTTDLVNLYNRNIFKTSLYIYIFQDEKCRHMRNLSLSMFRIDNKHVTDDWTLIGSGANELGIQECSEAEIFSFSMKYKQKNKTYLKTDIFARLSKPMQINR